MTETHFDLIILGGGPGGYVAAIRAAQLGRKVAVIERDHLGGICLNWGCIPTKALLRSAEVYSLIKHAEDYGLKVDQVSFDLKKIVDRSRKVSEQLAKGVQHLLKKNKVTVYKAQGKWIGRSGQKHKIQAASEILVSDHVIIATGAHARSLPGVEATLKEVWSYREAMVPDLLPQKLLVIGSGAIGVEFSSFYNALGSDVTLVEMMARILPAEDEEISNLAQKAFEKKGIVIKTNTSLSRLEAAPPSSKAQGGASGVKVTLTTNKGSSETLVFDRVIVAVGIVGNTKDLGLEGTKVTVEKDHIVVNAWCETGEPGIYAIGDVAGGPWLAHKASHEGVLVAERISGLHDTHPLKRERIPGCTYSNPQIASVGLTEKAARQARPSVKVGRFPFMGNGKAIALGEPEGLVKVIFDGETGELLGAHMIGAEVTELIQGYAIAQGAEATEAELKHTIFPHPTLSEMMHESVLDAYGQAIHF